MAENQQHRPPRHIPRAAAPDVVPDREAPQGRVMRPAYREQLDMIVNDLVRMLGLVRVAVHDATAALLTADLQLAEQVISNDQVIDDLAEEVERRSFSTLALQAPVAGELRTVFSAVRLLTELTRMGDLAAHVAKIARLRFPDEALPEELHDNFRRMAEVAEGMVADAATVLGSRDVEGARNLAHDDVEVDDLRREQFRSLVDSSWTHGVEAAVDTALLGRYYERIADHAVEVGQRLIYIATGTEEN